MSRRMLSWALATTVALSLLVGCGTENATGGQKSDATAATEGTVGTDATDATGATEGTDGTDGTDATDSTEGTGGTDGTGSTDGTGAPACDPPCTGTQKCVDGTCQAAQVCQPDSWVCNGLTGKKQCNVDGTGFMEAVDCPGDQYCTSGQCGLKCSLDPKWGAYVGCVFWTVDLPVWDDPTLPNADTLPHAVVVSNPNELKATVAFTPPPGVTFNFADLTIPGNSSKVFEFPSMDTSGSDITDLGVRLESDRPVLVHQFNPWDNTFSNDASLLLPEPLLGEEHLVLSWPTDARCLLEIPGLPNFGGPCAHSFLTVVAPFDNTEVFIRTTARVLATQAPAGVDPASFTPTVKEMAAGAVQIFVLNKGQVLNLDAEPETIFGIADLTGTLVLSDKPTAVFSGHDSASVSEVLPGPDFPDPDEPGSDTCCLDHLEEQMIPVPLLGTSYLATKSKDRGGESDLWRVVAAEDGVTITTIPPIDGLNGVTLSKQGEWVEAFTTKSFIIQTTARVLVGQYLVSQGQTDDWTGDPSMIVAIPIERFRATYPIMVPSTYSKNYVTVVRESDNAIQLDGAAVSDSSFDPIVGTTWELAWLEVSHGVHTITGAKPFGLSAYGYDSAASYGYPGGMTIPGEVNP